MEIDNKKEEDVNVFCDTKHEPHKDAKKRILLGFGVVLFVLGCVLLWLKFENGIRSTCADGDGVCNIKL